MISFTLQQNCCCGQNNYISFVSDPAKGGEITDDLVCRVIFSTDAGRLEKSSLLGMFEALYFVGKRSMMAAHKTLALPSSGIRFITCSTWSCGNRPHRWKWSWALDSSLEVLVPGREPTGPKRLGALLGEGGGVDSLGGEPGGKPQIEEEGGHRSAQKWGEVAVLPCLRVRERI